MEQILLVPETKCRDFVTLNSRQFCKEIANYLSQDKINWSFIPPRSPHFGGLWESSVKQAKYHLQRVVGNAILTFKELLTVFSQIEACMNSRCLSPLSNDLLPLTTGHFLTGEPMVALPESDVRDIKDGRLNRYERLKKMVQHFWYKECLDELSQRTKWKFPGGVSVKVGDFVVLKEKNLPPLKWSLGQIVDTYPGADNIVRVVLVKTEKGTFKRAAAKLCILPID